MAKRTTRGTVGAAIVLALAAVTACGGGDDSADDDGIAGVETSTPTGAPEGDEEDDTQDDSGPGEGRPEIMLSEDFEMVFENWAADDPVEQAILSDGRERIKSLHAAVIHGDAEAGHLEFYSADSALLTGVDWVRSFLDDNLTITGVSRYFDPEVSELDDGSTYLTYCNDQSGGHAVDRDTGAVQETSTSEEPYVFYQTIVEESADGVWQTVAAESRRGGCSP